MSSPVRPSGYYSSILLRQVGIPDIYNTRITEVFDIIVADQIWFRCDFGACFYYSKSDIISLFYFLFQYSRRHIDFPSVDEEIQSWPIFLLLYCCHKRNLFAWLD